MRKNIVAIVMVIAIVCLTIITNEFIIPFVLIPIEVNNNLSVTNDESINKKELLDDIVKVYSDKDIMYAEPINIGIDNTVSMNVYWREQYVGDGYHVYAQHWTNDNGNDEVFYNFLTNENQMIYSYKNEKTVTKGLVELVFNFALAIVFVYNVFILIINFIKKKK